MVRYSTNGIMESGEQTIRFPIWELTLNIRFLVRYKGQNNYQPSKVTQPQTVRSAPATFTITIPASVTATRYDKPEVGRNDFRR